MSDNDYSYAVPIARDLRSKHEVITKHLSAAEACVFQKRREHDLKHVVSKMVYKTA